jgi:hypothetical protein
MPSFISAFDFPANANFVLIKRIGSYVLAARGLYQTGPRLFGFQNSGLFSNWSIHERSMLQTKPFVPSIAVS